MCIGPYNMPQQRQVYGKSKAAFQISSYFGSDSPAEPRRKQTQLSSKSLQEVKLKRKALQDIDLNSRLQALSLNDPLCKPVVVENIKSSRRATKATVKQDDTTDSRPQPFAEIQHENQDNGNLDIPDSHHLDISDSLHSLENKDFIHDLNRLKSGDREAINSLRTFTSWGEAMQAHFNIEKIAEATYGEVYRLRLKHDHPTLSSNDESVLKVIALRPHADSTEVFRDQESLSSIDSVVNEVQLLQRMTSIPGFVNFRDVSVLRGRPGRFISAAWKAWNKGKSKNEKSQFPDPSRKSSYTDDQLWAVIEMQDAGTDLEKVQLPTIFHVWDVFWSVALSLAKAEEECRFEHRDLHLGNICVRNTSGSGLEADRTVRRPRNKRKVGYTTLETTVIDYTLSRADLGKRAQSPDNDVAFFDLSQDPEIFGGNAEDEYQYEVYRMMRSIVITGDPVHHLNLDNSKRQEDQISNGPRDNWKDHHALTNLLWLHYILETMLNALELRPGAEDDLDIRSLPEKEVVSLKKSALKLEKTLRAVRSMLKAETMSAMAEDGLTSAADLIWLALEEKWLTKEDVQSSMPGAC